MLSVYVYGIVGGTGYNQSMIIIPVAFPLENPESQESVMDKFWSLTEINTEKYWWPEFWTKLLIGENSYI